MKAPQCKTCACWKAGQIGDTEKRDGPIGTCRRYPQTVRTSHSHICWEYKEKKEHERAETELQGGGA